MKEERYANTFLKWSSTYGLREVDINKMGMSLKAHSRNVVAVKVTNTEGIAYFDLGLMRAVGK